MFHRKIYFLSLFTIFTFFNSNWNATEIHDYLQKGEEYYRARDYKNSVIQFRSALTMNPSSKKALLGYAKSSSIIGEKKDALDSYLRILSLDSKNRDALIGISFYYISQEKFDEALKNVNLVLENDPYDPDALVVLSQIYLKIGKKEFALKKLEEAKRKTAQNKDFLFMLANAYTETGKFHSSEDLLSNLIKENPDYPEAYFGMAELKTRLASLENYENRTMLIEEAYLNSKNALSIDKFYPDARRLFARVCIYLHKYDEAKDTLESLLEDFRNDYNIRYLYVYTLEKIGKPEKIPNEFKKILTTNELDDIARFYSEEYSIQHLKEGSELRSVLGEYRMERDRFDKRNFIFIDPNYNLMRAKYLIPQKNSVRSEILNYYLSKGLSKEFLNALIKIRNDDQNNFKIQNRLESAIKKQKESLSYLEGFIDLHPGGLRLNFEKSSPEIFLFDIFPEEFLDYKPNAAILINNSLKFYLTQKPIIKVITGKEEKAIREKLVSKSIPFPYTGGVYFFRELTGVLDEVRKNSNPIRYVGHGSYSLNKETLSVKYRVYDIETGKNITEFKLTASGRGYLGDITTRLAQKIISVLPVSGKTIKVKSNSVIVNFGGHDGITKNQKIVFERNGIVLGEGSVEKLDGLISEIVPSFKNWQNVLSIGDTVYPKK
ncbi:MAG: hypothetical protein L6Q54_01380 [Leptospiraceae bacterium]|nr:tetratricopeptide repeat protein [Leptospiraceae bacterium]MCK6379892.1 hypothetical protein [Leptospiraceae bacterium]NUM40227.1 tetratricopeptide repeat protein [Leptospiraceae bacterium]